VTLKTLRNPSKDNYEIRLFTDELTFLGVYEQPDFAELEVIMYPSDTIIELKSFKMYLYGYRNKIISYEHLINTIYDDLMEKYKPKSLEVIMKTKVRGGIGSILKVNNEMRNVNEQK